MNVITQAHIETAPLPTPLLGYATRSDDLGYTILFGAAVADQDRAVMAWSMAEEMRLTGRDRAWRVSVR